MTAVTERMPEQGLTGSMKTYTVRGGGGLRLHVREWGKPDGPPILFIHGWSQNHLCWAKQYESSLADEFRLVAYDLRGHGMSEAPLEPAQYTAEELWADDVAAIIEELGLDRPVLVGWSYGAFVICDYVRACGQDRIAAINFVEGVVKLGEAAFGTFVGPGFLDHFVAATADDLPTNIWAMRSFVRTCLVKPVSDDDFETAMCWNVVVPAHVRAASGRARSTRRRPARSRGADARHARPDGLGRAAGDGRARPGDLPDRRGLLVRGCRPCAAPRGARALQPRACRADPPGPGPTIIHTHGANGRPSPEPSGCAGACHRLQHGHHVSTLGSCPSRHLEIRRHYESEIVEADRLARGAGPWFTTAYFHHPAEFPGEALEARAGLRRSGRRGRRRRVAPRPVRPVGRCDPPRRHPLRRPSDRGRTVADRSQRAPPDGGQAAAERRDGNVLGHHPLRGRRPRGG